MTDQQMDEAVAKYRQMTVEEFHQELIRSPDFKTAIEEAYARGVKDPSKNFITFDRDGWNPVQFNARISPAQPRNDRWGPGAPNREKELMPLPGAAIV